MSTWARSTGGCRTTGEAIQIRRQLFTAHPEKRAYLLDLAEALSTLGNIQRHAGDSAAAHESFFDARSLLERAAAATPGDEVLPVSLGAALIREAGALADLREPEQARPLARARGENPVGRLGVRQPKKLRRREWQSEALWELARILRVLKNTAEAEGSMPSAWPCGKIGRPASWPPWLSRRRARLP